MKIMPFVQWKNLAPPPASSFSNCLQPIGRVMALGIRDPSVFISGTPLPHFLSSSAFLHPLSLPELSNWQLRRSWTGWRGKGMDVIAGQGEQSVGRDVDTGMTGTRGGSGID